MIKNLKETKKALQEQGVFYTQPELAAHLKSYIPDGITEIYDPTCGVGGLLSVFPDEVMKYGQDIDGEAIEYAKKHLKNFIGEIGDTLKNPAFMDRKFKYIIANPPFSVKWEQVSDERFSGLPALPPKSKADYAFIAHILHMLSDDGIAVVLEFPGITYRGNSEGKIREWFVRNNYIDTVEAIDGGHFVDTKIATVCVVIRKNKKTSDIKFKHNDFEKVVSFKEVEENSFNLSVSTYIDEEPEKEKIDPVTLEMHARKGLLEHLDGSLAFSKFVSQTENIPFIPLLDECEKIIWKFRKEENNG